MKISLLKLLVISLIIISINTEVTGQDIMKLSLKEAQDYAVVNNNTMKNAELDLQLAKKKIWETTAIGLPQLGGQLNYQHLFQVPMVSFGGITSLETNLPPDMNVTSDDIINENIYLAFTPGEPIPLGVKDNTTVDFTVSQLVFSGEYLVGLRASKVFYLISDQSKIKTETEVRESVANTYSLVLVLMNNLEVMNQSLDNLNKTLNEMRAMYQQGFIENTDVDQVELTTLTLENSLTSVERQVKSAVDLLKFQIGLPMDREVALTDSLELLAENINLENLISNGFNVEQNIDYQILDTQVRLGKLNLQREKTTFLPSIAAVYRHTEKFKKIDFDFTPTDIFMLTVNVPIFSSGQKISKVQQRRLEYEKAVNNKDDVTRGLTLEYANARNEVINAYDNYTNVKRNLELTNRIYQKTLIKYKEGLSSSMDLTQAQNQFLSAQAEYTNNIYSLLIAKNKLTKLTINQ